MGTCWAVYVKPSHRRRGVGEALMQRCVAHWRSIGCLKGVLLHATAAGRALYEKVGFAPHNGMVVDLEPPKREQHPASRVSTTVSAKQAEFLLSSPPSPPSLIRHPSATGSESPTQTDGREDGEEESTHGDEAPAAALAALRAAGVVGEDWWLSLLAHALPQQLDEAFGKQSDRPDPTLIEKVKGVQRELGTLIDREDNWLTRNISRLGGGFDMKKLAEDPRRLAAKFDRLAGRYEEWVVGNRSKVGEWLSKMARRNAASLSGPETRALDVACGIGLPGHQLRLCGYRGRFVGSDISAGMLEKANERGGAYDSLVVADANKGLGFVAAAEMDLVICTGALELLNHSTVLAEVARVLKPGGQLWASFQHEEAGDATKRPTANPTAHQNVRGISRQEMVAELNAAGLELASVEQCDDAFYTPSEGELRPVPYLFVVARKPA
jgi:predicted TPR repeat methyltransferase